MICITDGQLRLGGRIIFSRLSWRVEVGKRVGLVGPNGAGKTSILRVLIGEYPLEDGTLETSKNLRIGYLPQDGSELPRCRVYEILLSAFGSLNRMEEEMRRLLQVIQSTSSASPEHEKAVHRYGVLQEEFEQGGGYRRESDAKKVLLGLGFQHKDWDRPVEEFSGGWRMRVLLARLLLEKPDILLLDEPTNHLDPESLAWFENDMKNSAAGLVMVSHDRYLLDRVVTEIAEIERGAFRTFKGNYTRYRKQKEALREQLVARKKNQQREIAHLEAFVERFRAKNTKATQAQSRIKRLKKIERIELEPERATVSIPLPVIPRSGKEVLKLESVGHRYGEQRALHPITAMIHRGDRVAVWGPNGAGKSTLLSLMAKEFEPTEGTVTWGYNTLVVYFSQHHAELQTSQKTVLDELSTVAPAEMQSRLRDVLAPFLFRGDDVMKCVSVLSGGEKSRLALAKLLIRPVNVLILDEPLNHLDLKTVETLENTLRHFEGTIVFVSHDRFFADRLATQIWEMNLGRIQIYKGNYSDYEYAKRYREEHGSGDDSVSSASGGNSPAVILTPGNSRQERKEQRRREAEERKRIGEQQREQKKKFATIEQQIHKIEQEIAELEAIMATGDNLSYATEMPKQAKHYKTLLKMKEKLYAEWEKIVESME